MSLDQTKLKHTICFCIAQDQVLMLYRKYSPNKDHWNGIGGKIEPGETPTQGIYREAMEEAGVDLTKTLVNFVGIVTWSHDEKSEIDGGMYAFIVHLDKPHLKKAQKIGEGILEYKSLSWVCSKKNQEVVKNIAIFLPVMLGNQKLYEYRCIYHGELLLKLIKKRLSSPSVASWI